MEDWVYPLLQALIEDSNAKQDDIAHRSGVKKISERMAALRANGTIERFTIDINYKKIGLGTIAFIPLRVREKSQERVEHIGAFLAGHPNVTEVYELLGQHNDYLVKIRCRDNEEMLEIAKAITSLDNIIPEQAFTMPVGRIAKAMPGAVLQRKSS